MLDQTPKELLPDRSGGSLRKKPEQILGHRLRSPVRPVCAGGAG
jgi:hypothetical protein